MSRCREGGPTRCAIYTRKSTEEGLDQVFNTLDAQREACEAYIKSQAGEGWRALPDYYDDGGFSGGNMDRPAINRLLTDIDAGKVDVIVVYKVDRLTRSLMDFARIVERLDTRGVSFVSVTQAFNTTTSMGRLTLNVLLSFAQFEREVTGERIRDKIAASKAKGMWMGGTIPLGYDLQDRNLVINEEEAEQVRRIFTRYLALGSGVDLMKELRTERIVSKVWTSRAGRQVGGVPFGCGALYYLLQNRLYVGEIVHRSNRHPGQHDAIVTEALFEAVQQKLASNRQEKRRGTTRVANCPLTGLVFDAEGVPMSPSFSYGRPDKPYRYYVSASVLPGKRMKPAKGNVVRRVSAAGLESLVLDRLTQLFGAPEPLSWSTVADVLRRVELWERSIHLVVDASTLVEPHEPIGSAVERFRERMIEDRLAADEDGLLRLICNRRPRFRGGEVMSSHGASIVPVADPGIISMLKAAHVMLEHYSMSPLNREAHIRAEAPLYQRDRRLMAMGLISPSLQRRILEGQFTVSGASLLVPDVPLAWSDQIGGL